MTPEELEKINLIREKDRLRKAAARRAAKTASEREHYKRREAGKKMGRQVLSPWMIDELGNPSRTLSWEEGTQDDPIMVQG